MIENKVQYSTGYDLKLFVLLINYFCKVCEWFQSILFQFVTDVKIIIISDGTRHQYNVRKMLDSYVNVKFCLE